MDDDEGAVGAGVEGMMIVGGFAFDPIPFIARTCSELKRPHLALPFPFEEGDVESA